MESLKKEAFGAYKFENVWKNDLPEIKEDIVDFWQTLNALPPKSNAEDRVKQVVFIIRDEGNNVVGICTAYPAAISSLGFNMFYFRCLVHPDHRKSHLAAELLLRTWKFLNNATDANDDDACKGVIVESENPIINQVKNETVWPNSGMIYIGKTKQGLPIRIRYFDSARI